MGDTLIAILLGAALLSSAGILYYFLPKEIAAWRSGDNPWRVLQTRMRLRAYRKRLLAPEPAQVERRLGALLPERLLALYDDKETILANEFRVLPKASDPESESFIVNEFLPLDTESQLGLKDMSAFGKGFAFARGSVGYFWLPLEENRQEDAPVYHICLEDGQNTLVAGSLEEFLSWPRVPG